MKDEGVNEGLSDYKPGINVQDKFAMVALIILVLTGLFYSLRMIFTPDTVIGEGFPSDEAWVVALGSDASRALGQGVPSEVTVAVSGSLILVYTLWSALVLTNGASGQVVSIASFAIRFHFSDYWYLHGNASRYCKNNQ